MAKKILVVDDERDIVEIYRRALNLAGYEVVSAYNGEEGLRILRANPNFDLVVLDLKMPKMTGDEFLKAVRSDPLLKNTKVMVMSSILYRYQETDIYDPETGTFIRTKVEQKGLSNMAKRADKSSAAEKDSLDLEEKKKARLVCRYSPDREPENESEFERDVSEDLIRRIKDIFGEPYDDTIFKDKNLQRQGTVIEEKIKDIIAEILKVEREKLHYSSVSFEKDLGVAFIDATQLVKRIEEEFRVRINWEDQRNIETLHDLVYAIEHLKMYARTKHERIREENRKLWHEWKPFFYIGVVIPCLVLLGMLIWDLIIKKYFLKTP